MRLMRYLKAFRITPKKQPETEFTPEKQIVALQFTLNKSAERMQVLWFSFLALELYIAIAVTGVTHKDLFLQSPIKLPGLNLDFPLLLFFILIPAIFFTFHFYVMMMLVLLARTAAEFDNKLKETLASELKQEELRQRFENSLFLQMLVGARNERVGFNGKILGFIALCTLLITPILLLLWMQLQFLPYHSEGITWWHRLFIALDVLATIMLWSAYRKNRGIISFKSLVRFKLLPVFLIVSLWLSLATFPDETIHNNKVQLSLDKLQYKIDLVYFNWQVAANPEFRISERFWRDHIFGGYRNLAIHQQGPQGKPSKHMNVSIHIEAYKSGMFNNRLILDGFSVIDDEKVKKITNSTRFAKGSVMQGIDAFTPIFDAKSRDFTEAILSNSDLRFVNFSNAIMERVDIKGAHLNFALFRNAKLLGSNFSDTILENANFEQANMELVDLSYSQANKASFSGANLTGSTFSHTDLQKTYLSGVLDATSMSENDLRGANFSPSSMRAANIASPQLEGICGIILLKSSNDKLKAIDTFGTSFRKGTPNQNQQNITNISEICVNHHNLFDKIEVYSDSKSFQKTLVFCNF
jgi:uncharacterized protein YjbI with pentapeptide repeats